MSLLRHIGTCCACTHATARLHPCIHDASGQRDAAEEIVAGRLAVFQRNDTNRICGRVTRCSISSFETAGLWPWSGYRGGRVSETKSNALINIGKTSLKWS